MKIKSVGLREIGIVVILVTVIMAFLLISFIDTLSRVSQESCTCGDVCGMVEPEMPAVIYAGWIGTFAMFFIGIMLFLKGGTFGPKADGKGAWVEKLKTLEDDEKTVYRLIMDSGGTLFQSEIVEKIGWSKVKVTRTLDRLESRRLLERRRRGLTNIVVLR